MGCFGMADTDQDRKARLDALEAKASAEKRAPEEAKRHQDEHHSQVHAGWRMVIELVTGLGIGFGMGYGLDVLFDTLPVVHDRLHAFGICGWHQDDDAHRARNLRRMHPARMKGTDTWQTTHTQKKAGWFSTPWTSSS